MKRFLIALSLLAASCSAPHPDIGLAPPVKMPALPPELSKKADRLPDLTDPSMGAAHQDGVETDKKYNAVGHQLNTVIDLWDCTRIALETKKDPNKCFDEILK